MSPGRLLVLLGLLRGAEQTCPPSCLCVSDTVSCSSGGLSELPPSLPLFSATLDLSHNRLSRLASGSFGSMPRLETLRVAHNRLGALRHGVFLNATGLRHLDLSSNRLRVLERHSFLGLWRLEELLLFNNRIRQVEGGALSGLSRLKKVYLSLNHITHFPFFSMGGRSHPLLATLDLSSNRLARLPWGDVEALPGPLQRGLYLHNNSLICDCAALGVLRRWDLRGYDSLRGFRDEHTCRVGGDPGRSVRFLRQTRLFHNCTAEEHASQALAVLVSEGSRVQLDCDAPPGGADVSVTWLSPGGGYVARADPGAPRLALFPNGTLEIREAAPNDSGLYTCTAVDAGPALNASRQVNVTVVPAGGGAFSTGYTTLLGCLVTLVLILAYLYLTPCPSRCRQQPGPSVDDPGAPTPGRGRARSQADKHVAFMEPGAADGGAA